MISQKMKMVLLCVSALAGLVINPLSAFATDTRVLDRNSTVHTTYILQLKKYAPEILGKDSKITDAQPVFVDAKTEALKNTFQISSTYSLSDLKNKYSSEVVYIEPELSVQAGSISVNDPGFSGDPTNADRQWGLLKARFPDAWDKSKGASNVTVAIIDTGIDGTHEDLSNGQVGPGFNFLTRTVIPSGLNSDDNGHGTLVAGVIGATTNNFKGIAGANWQVFMVPLKALDAKGSGNSADIASAIVWAADHGANIINMSLGGIGFGNDTTLSNAISYAYKKDVVLIAAAGNDVAVNGGDVDLNPVFPVCDDNGQNMIVGVVATDINDQKASFSNYGKNCVDVSAPGKRILTIINYDTSNGTHVSDGYAYASGTSLAAPFVSAEAVLLKAYYPRATNKEIQSRIIKSADPIDQLNPTQCGGASCAGMIGSGRINTLKAFDDSLTAVQIQEGQLVKSDTDGTIYLISGGVRQKVTSFVLKQRFTSVPIVTVPNDQLQIIPLGSPALPLEGTYIKSYLDPTVFAVINGYKRPVTYQVFLQRGITSEQINSVDDQELSVRITGTFLPPLEGTLVKSSASPTVYWVVDGLLHPINYKFWTEKGLNIFPIMIMSSNDVKGYAQGNAYIR